MEKKKPLVTDELIIVGGRHGELSDKLIPLFCEGNPIEEKDIRKEIGCEIVYLMRSNNDHDPYAIGVFTSSMKRLGYLWVHQSYAMYEWMLAHKVGRVRARICRVNTKYGFMISKPLTPMKRTIRPSENLFLNMDWGNDLPKLQHCRMIEKLNLSMMMLEDALAEDMCSLCVFFVFFVSRLFCRSVETEQKNKSPRLTERGLVFTVVVDTSSWDPSGGSRAWRRSRRFGGRWARPDSWHRRGAGPRASGR